MHSTQPPRPKIGIFLKYFLQTKSSPSNFYVFHLIQSPLHNFSTDIIFIFLLSKPRPRERTFLKVMCLTLSCDYSQFS